MYDVNNKSVEPINEYERISKLGSFLRSSSIDELPTLINIIKGGYEFNWSKASFNGVLEIL